MGIKDIKEYFVSMEHTDNLWVINVKFNKSWSGYSSDDGKITAMEDDDKPKQGVWWYYGKDDEVELEDIFTLIKETADLNIEMEKKAALFTEKAKKLREIFSDTKYSYDELLALEFVFNDTQAKVINPIKNEKKKAAKKTKKDVLNSITISEVEPEVIDKPTTQSKSKKKKESNSDFAIGDGVVINATELSQSEIDDLRG